MGFRQNRLAGYLAVFTVVIVLFLTFFHGGCKPERRLKEARVLVIHSFKKEVVSYPDMNRMIVEELRARGFEAELQVFYLDCDAIGAKEELATIRELLDTMRVTPEVVLVTDDPATYSLLKCGHPLVEKVPIVFTSVNFPNWTLLKEHPNVTGIWDRIDFLANVEMIERLMGFQRVRLYYDKTYIGRKTLEEVAVQLEGRDGELSGLIRGYLADSTQVRIPLMESEFFLSDGQRLKGKLEGTKFYFQNLRDEQGGTVLWYINSFFERSVSLLTRYDYTISRIGNMSTTPTFSVVGKEFGYGQGVLGGHFMTLEEQVKEGCDYLARVLAGTPVSSLPVKEGKKGSVLDWREMERWGMEKSVVEKDFTIVNMPFHVEYRTEVLAAGVLTGALIVFVIVYLSYLLARESRRKKQAQQGLRDEKEFLSLVLEGGNIFAWSYESVSEEFTFDQEFAASMGIGSRMKLVELMGKTHPDDVDNAVSQFIKVVKGEEERMTVSARINFSGSDYVWYEFRSLGLPRRANGDAGAIGAILSIQHFKEHEEELVLARDLAAKTELKQSFLANMSHEIRTPLNAIVGFSNILVDEEDVDEEEKKVFIASINTNCELLLKLVNDVLELSRIESGNLSFQFDGCSVNRIVEEVYQMNYLAVPSSISLVKEVLPEDVMLVTDCIRLKQVLINFVNNGLKFTSKGHVKIGVEWRRAEGEVCFYVEDTGIGIPAEEQQMIFDRFYKYDEFTQGTGLGLSICSVIAERLKGRITIDSEVGKGCRFGIVVPWIPEDSEGLEGLEGLKYAREEVDGVPAEDGRPVVLIAEDSASNYMVLSRILKKHFTIIWVLNGREALDVIGSQAVDLVLMDIKMQEMDGITALRRIRKTRKDLPVIIQSAYAYEENREQARRAGCAGFIEKPVHASRLMEAIGKCLSMKGV